ncbi:NUMOD1 domain-containing DNA-binding protein [Marinifilum flexuosum]|uniref:NUMOD1 domain-containing DNA-binding protein n=1 Tax=Marinifilum flexuosum TaxID=1117708 RepID=UPI002495668D|nr:NUMOD1 domain-containing DNA-binding protein [Marinifilum flexuosum]
MKKAIIKLDLQGKLVNKFESISAAAKSIGTNYLNISRCVNGKSKTSKGFIWITQEEYELIKTDPEMMEELLKERASGRKGKAIVQLSMEGEVINEFVSIAQAAKEIKGSKSNIARSLNNKRRSASKFRWYSKEEYNKLEGNVPPFEKYSTQKAVVKLDKDGSKVKEWESIRKAAEELNLKSALISRALKGKAKLDYKIQLASEYYKAA